ncbi:hypothetical protein VPH35_007272 [Triticum aestivum]
MSDPQSWFMLEAYTLLELKTSREIGNLLVRKHSFYLSLDNTANEYTFLISTFSCYQYCFFRLVMLISLVSLRSISNCQIRMNKKCLHILPCYQTYEKEYKKSIWLFVLCVGFFLSIKLVVKHVCQSNKYMNLWYHNINKICCCTSKCLNLLSN